jgi:hypothetical protein
MPVESRLIMAFGALAITALIGLSLREGRIVISPVNIDRTRHAEGFWAVIGLQAFTAGCGLLLAIWP